MLLINHITIRGKVADLSLQVNPGELVAVVGSRGSGKTSLLRALLGQCPTEGGSALVGDVPLASPAGLSRCGVAGEAWGLMERLTAWENLAAFARLSAVPEGRAAELLQRLDLTSRQRVRVGALTPGEAARLRLARALLHDPAVLLLDEPAGDIDSESASLIAFTIGEEVEAGKAVLVTTFGDPRIVQMATRIAYLEGGRLVEAPRPEEAGPPAAAQPAEAPEDQAPAADPPGAGAGAAGAQVAEVSPVVPRPRAIPHVAARKGDRVLLFRPDQIRYAYAQDKAVYVETVEGTCGVSFTLSELQDRLGESGFFRSHKAYLVNLACVKEIASWTRDSFSLILTDGKEIPLSKHRAQELRTWLNW